MPRPFRRPEYRKAPVIRPPSGRYDAPADPAIEVESLEMGKTFPIDAVLAQRLLRREVNPREAFTLKDASGTYYRASVKELTAGGGAAVPYEKFAISPEPTVAITLACAVLGRQRMIFVAQKATELGVSRIIPLLTEKSVPPQDLEHEKAHAWPGQIIRAAKQCRRSSLPELRAPMTLDAFLSGPLGEADLSLCLDNVAGKAPAAGQSPKRILLFVGPEGGFSDAERKKLEGKTQPWILGGRILRAETAILVGLSAVHLTWGDFRP